jgi:transposase
MLQHFLLIPSLLEGWFRKDLDMLSEVIVPFDQGPIAVIGAIKSPQVVEFLRHLMRHLPDKLLIIWDGLPSHRSHLVWDFVRQQRGRLWLEFLPAYAPKLNPVEYLWSHWKQHELPNFCPSTFAQLSLHARCALKRMRRRPTLVMAFWQQAQLFPL